MAFLILGRQSSGETEQKPISYVELTPRVEAPVRVAPSGAASRPFIEAPGPEVEQAPSERAPLSDANRVASTPQPSGERLTDRPGTGSGLDFTGAPGLPSPRSVPSGAESGSASASEPTDATVLRPEPQRGDEGAPSINWRAAIEQATVATPPSEAGSMGRLGGEEGFAASGPVSFETSWYPWGDYALTMLRRVRYYWYENMPELIRLGVKGNVTVRFTIQRDGTITDITTLRESGSPPYDFAARKAISLSSPLPPLPADFPKASERVTISFFYNMAPPRGEN